MTFTELIMAAQVRDGTSNGDKWSAIMEIVLVTFFITLIPYLLVLDPRSLHWYDLWKPVLSACMAGLWAYMRARDIPVVDEK